MAPIGGEAFVYILIICIRLNRNYHLKLTNGEQGSLERESGTQLQWWDCGQTLFDQVSETSSAPETPRVTRSLRVGTQTFSGHFRYAFGGCALAGAYGGHRPTFWRGGVFEISTKLDLPPLCLWERLDLVTPVHAPQQRTPPIWFFPFQPSFSSLWHEACQLGL